MKRKLRLFRFGLFMVVLALALYLMTDLAGRNPNPGILPPNSTPFGQTYAGWSARWWQWAFNTNPDVLGCDTSQTSHVFFLAGSWFDPAGKKSPGQTWNSFVYTDH